MKPGRTTVVRTRALAWRVVALLALGSAAALAQLTPAAPPTREQVERRLQSTGVLIGQSSAARQIESSSNIDAKIQLAKARELHAMARTALAGGDLEGSNKLLHASQRTLMEAVVLASPETVTDKKERNDYDARRESTRALLDAARRISTEKDAGPRNAELLNRVEALITEADRLVTAGQPGDGRRTLDQAYGAARAAVSSLRGGETLVRSLHFATEEEEFRYEIDRNDTHRMLVALLLQDRRSFGSVDAMVERALQESARLRKLADEQATRREYEPGVKLLEDSTRELIRAIRAAGVYIPG